MTGGDAVARFMDGTVVLHRISATEVVGFGRPQELDLLGSTLGEVDRPSSKPCGPPLPLRRSFRALLMASLVVYFI